MGCGASGEIDATVCGNSLNEAGPGADVEIIIEVTSPSNCDEYRRAATNSQQAIERCDNVGAAPPTGRVVNPLSASENAAKPLQTRDHTLPCGRPQDSGGELREMSSDDAALPTFEPQTDTEGMKSPDAVRPAVQSSVVTEGMWQYSVMSGGQESGMNAGSLAGYRGSGFAESGVIDGSTLRGASRTDTLLSGASGNVEGSSRLTERGEGEDRPLRLAKFYAADEL